MIFFVKAGINFVNWWLGNDDNECDDDNREVNYNDDEDVGKVTCEHADHLLPAVAQVCQQVAWRRKEHVVNIAWNDENEYDEDYEYTVTAFYHISSAHSDVANNPYSIHAAW